MKNIVNSIFAVFGGTSLYLLGGYDKFIQALLLLIIIDYVTGLLKASYTKKLNSKIGYKGIIKKVMMFFVIAVSVILTNVIEVDNPLREIVIIFFITNESISILENASEFLPIPKVLTNLLEQMKKESH